MTANDCLFKYKDGYILLEDLESWYSHGFVTAQDRIQIFQGTVSVNYKISALMMLYGDRFPFRRIPKNGVDPLVACSSSGDVREENDKDVSPSTSPLMPPPRAPSPIIQNSFPPKKLGGAFGAKHGANSVSAPKEVTQRNPSFSSEAIDRPPRPPQNKIMEDSNWQYRDYPLYNVDDEPDDDQKITGNDVIDEMRKLKELAPLNEYPKGDFDYFVFLHRKNYRRTGLKPSVAICRLCNYTPFSGHLFLKHLFNEDHIQALSKYMISKSSFQFWEDHFDQYKQQASGRGYEPTETKSTFMKGKPTADFFPTIPLFSSDVSTDIPKLDPSIVSTLLSLAADWQWREDQTYLPKYYKSVTIPTFCDVCQEEVEWHKTRFTKHIISEKHLSGLTGISRKELNFWVNILTLEGKETKLRHTDRTRILEFRNPRPIPLIDFKLESPLLEERMRASRIKELETIFNKIDRKRANESVSGMLDASGNSLNQDIACFACDLPRNHFKTQLHLVDHLFTEKHLNYLRVIGFSEKAFLWWKKFLSVFPTVSIPSQQPTAAQDPPTKNISGNIPRVPLLDFPLDGAKKSTQQEFVLSIRTMVSSLKSSGKGIATNKIVNWKCAYCCSKKQPSIILRTELEAFQHIVSQKHLEKMKFVGALDDLNYWKKQVIDINSVINEKTVIPSNVPRVPMLDRISPNAKFIPLNKELLLHLMKYRDKFEGKYLERAKAMKINWRCTFCREPGVATFFSYKLYAYYHILLPQHWKNMGSKTTKEDLAYWTDWVKAIFSPSYTMPQKIPATFKEPPKKVGAQLLLQNNPRAALIDDMPKGAVAVSKEKFNEMLNECQRKFKSGGKAMLIDRASVVTHWNCSFCSTSTKKFSLSNQLDAFCHIVKESHREKMQYTACLSDLEYWKTWVDKLYAKHVVGSVPVQKPTEVKTNNPRIPLLDKPRNLDYSMTQSVYLTRYNAIQTKLRSLKSNKATDQKVDCTCYYCPGGPKMFTIYEVMLHVFDGRHFSYIHCLGLPSDFEYFDDLIKTMPSNVTPPVEVVHAQCMMSFANDATPKISRPSPRPAPSVTTTITARPPVSSTKTLPISVVNPVCATTSVESAIRACTYPLFCLKPFNRTSKDSTCPGPTNRQIEFIRKTTVREYTPHMQMFATPTKCSVCNVVMSNWSLIQVATHAFSVDHLNQLKSSGSAFYTEDFEWWINKLNQTTFLRVPYTPSQPTNCYLGGLKKVTRYSMQSLGDSIHLTETEQAWIANVAESKLENPNTMVGIMIKFGCCVHCNLWFLKPLDAIHHFLSDQHFAKVKGHCSYDQRQVNSILDIVKNNQKDSKK
ncbi:hypothetical protein GCK72_000016 [Caenorhabditis remanei]|uniref:Uncharacterized protein n=1 Tax=Caenorhabditis remanei TaxID=31234 RepID=A0A6A5HNP3_CAERE|nr:hypothetical protein GCK72_000016 [Caenorhabditis remanei]KAF1768204.1 hypothetical protein GCK72_000016 [Caenorhabditis remanei]